MTQINQVAATPGGSLIHAGVGFAYAITPAELAGANLGQRPDLLARKGTVYSLPSGQLYVVNAAGNALVRADVDVNPASNPRHFALREFKSLQGVTNAATGGTVTPSIDGENGMKLAIGAAVTQHDVTISGLSLPNFTAGRGKVVVLVRFADTRAISQVQSFVGTDTGFATSLRTDFGLANTGINHTPGVQAIVIQPDGAAANNLSTTSTITALRLRIQRSASPITNGIHNLPGDVAASTVATDMWVIGAYVVAETKPFVVLTFDDASISWTNLLQPELAARGLKATFGVNRTDVGTNPALFINEAQLNDLYAYGHDVSSHNQTNTSFTIASKAAYIAEFQNCRAWHYAAGRNRRLDYHPFVQGAANPEVANDLRNEGLRYGRSVNERNFERPLFDYGMHLQMPSRTMGNVNTIDNALGWLTSAKLRQQDVIVMGHELLAGPSVSTTTWNIADVRTFLDACVAGVAAGSLAGVGSLSEYLCYLGFEK